MTPFLKPPAGCSAPLSFKNGLDLREGAGENCLRAMKNLIYDPYPCLSVRPARGDAVEAVAPGEEAVSCLWCGAPCLVTRIASDGEYAYRLHRNGKTYLIGRTNAYLREGMPDGGQKVVLFGHKLVLMPLGFYIDLDALPADPDPQIACGGNVKIDGQWAGSPRYRLCSEDGELLPNVRYTYLEPQDTTAVWVDIGQPLPVCRIYNVDDAEWQTVAHTFVRVEGSFDRNGALLCAGEKVSFVNTGCGLDGIHTLLRADFTENSRGRCDGFLVIEGILHGEYDDIRPFPMSMHRVLPEVDFVIECGNRLWGCRYGADAEGKFVNEIYASSPGSIDRFYLFEGISTDSFVASRGTPGAFTGAVNYFGTPIFLRERMMHKVQGTLPQNFHVLDLPCEGVKEGCSGSVSVVGQRLYYFSPSGPTVYDGGLPVALCGRPADFSRVTFACGGRDGDRYCLSASFDGGRPRLFLFDPSSGVWTEEDDAGVRAFLGGDRTYVFDGGALRALRGAPDASLPFMLKSAPLTFGLRGRKSVARLWLRYSLSEGCHAGIYLRFDGKGPFLKALALCGKGKNSVSASLRPRPFDRLEVMIEGTGAFRLEALSFDLHGRYARPER